MAHILWSDDEYSTTHTLVGGKGANLGRLTRAGFDVPAGFTVTTAAHDVFLGGDLPDRVVAMLSEADPGCTTSLASVCARIREAVLAQEMPASVAESIRAAYAEMAGEPYVAVRSSGTAEDLASASFAGLHDTYLDIRGGQDVVNAVHACWASLFTERATAYRASRGFDHRAARMGVVVQIMVESEAAGGAVHWQPPH
jgi:pyruvate,water dikinase